MLQLMPKTMPRPTPSPEAIKFRKLREAKKMSRPQLAKLLGILYLLI